MSRKKRVNNHIEKDKARRYLFIKRGGLFCLLTIIGNVVVYLMTEAGWLSFFEQFTAQTAGLFMTVSGLQPVLQDNMIRFGTSIWLVDTECTAINLMMLFSAFILSYPSFLKQKFMGLAVGLPFIMAANIMRLVVLVWVAKFTPVYTKYFHDYVWQVAFLIMIAFMWLYWIEKLVKHASTKQVPA